MTAEDKNRLMNSSARKCKKFAQKLINSCIGNTSMNNETNRLEIFI